MVQIQATYGVYHIYTETSDDHQRKYSTALGSLSNFLHAAGAVSKSS